MSGIFGSSRYDPRRTWYTNREAAASHRMTYRTLRQLNTAMVTFVNVRRVFPRFVAVGISRIDEIVPFVFPQILDVLQIKEPNLVGLIRPLGGFEHPVGSLPLLVIV